MSLTRTKKIAATTAAASLAVGGILLATAPAATAAPGSVLAEYGAPVVQVPLGHALTVAARDTGIPAAIANANVTIPVPGWTRIIDASADSLSRAIARGAQYPNGCSSYQFYLPPNGVWAVNATSYANCPW